MSLGQREKLFGYLASQGFPPHSGLSLFVLRMSPANDRYMGKKHAYLQDYPTQGNGIEVDRSFLITYRSTYIITSLILPLDP